MLLAAHQRLIDASAISAEVAAARGYRTIDAKSNLEALGFSASQRRVPALLMPIYDHRGEIATYHLRPDEPRVLNGRALKYETPAGSRMVVDVPPATRPRLGDPSAPLFITEGVRKADAAVSAGLCCVGLMGTWCWRGTNESGGKALLADFDAIAFNNRDVYVVFDSDVTVKPSVHAAVERLTPILRNRGAKVQIIYLPDNEDGGKVGLDDYLSRGHSTDELLTLAEPRLRPLIAAPGEAPYAADAGGLVWQQRTRGGVVPVRIANFAARIVSERELDDGAEVNRSFVIEASLRGRTQVVDVPLNEFRDGSWVLARLGGEAIVEAVPRSVDHLAAGIQHLSGEIPKRRAYAHTGWVLRDGEWLYLSASGGVGHDGLVDVDVELPPGLQAYALPDPPVGAELKAAIRGRVDLLHLAPDQVMFPILAAIYRAPLGSLDVVVFVVGQTGSFKTALAAVAQQHYGAGLDAHHLPLSFTDTANALEGELFLLKDVVAVVDDFAPGGTRNDVQRAHRDADRVFRSAANGQGRRRMRADATIRAAKPPRAQIIATGEDLPQGHSLRARTHVIQVEPSAIDAHQLSTAQRQADEGILSAALAGYVRWLSPLHDEITSTMKSDLAELRDQLRGVTAHRRPVEGAASLLLGMRYLVQYAEESGAITAAERQELWDRAWAAIHSSAASQNEHHESAEPVARFLGLLASALGTGLAHIADLTGNPPFEYQPWGWRNRDDPIPQGRRIGWLDEDDLYLDRDAAYAVAQRLASENGEALPTSPTTLAKRLHEKNLLLTTEQTVRGTLTVRKKVEGQRRPVLHLSVTSLYPADAGHGGQLGQSPEETEAASAQQQAAAANQLELPVSSSPEADPTDQPDPCQRESHRHTDWTSISGKRVCGICHPPASPEFVAGNAPEPNPPIPF